MLLLICEAREISLPSGSLCRTRFTEASFAHAPFTWALFLVEPAFIWSWMSRASFRESCNLGVKTDGSCN